MDSGKSKLISLLLYGSLLTSYSVLIAQKTEICARVLYLKYKYSIVIYLVLHIVERIPTLE